MGAPANLGFETAGAPFGTAASWTITDVATAVELAFYSNGVGISSAVEGFETEWDNELYIYTFDLLVDVEAAVYSVGLLIPPPEAEGFEVGWDFNQEYLFDLGPAAAAEYGTGLDTEDSFESEWNNDVYLTSFDIGVDTFVAMYGITAYESFETGWGNTTYLTVFNIGADTFVARYENDGVSWQDFEDFEECRENMIVTCDPNTFTITTQDPHPFSNDDIVQLTSDGPLPSGISPRNEYRVINAATPDFQISASIGGPAIEFSTPGGGTIEVVSDKQFWWVEFLIG